MSIYIAISLIVIIYLLYRVVILEGRIKQLQSTLNQVRDYPEMSKHPVNDELRMLIKEEKDIKAVKRAREVFGFSLLEGKEYVDELKKDNK